MDTFLKVIALLSSGLFAGAALYITAVEHPARISQGALIALQEFRPSYKRAAPLQASLAVICFLCCVVVAGLYGAYSVGKKILFIQAAPAAVALFLLLAFGR